MKSSVQKSSSIERKACISVKVCLVVLARLVQSLMSLINDFGGKDSGPHVALILRVCDKQGRSGHLPHIVNAGVKGYLLPLVLLVGSILFTSCILHATCISGMLEGILAESGSSTRTRRGHKRPIQSLNRAQLRWHPLSTHRSEGYVPFHKRHDTQRP